MTANSTAESTASEPSDPDETGESTPRSDALDVRIDPDGLTRALDGAGALVEECLLSFDGGLRVRARDPADVAMAEFRLPASVFESYSADGQRYGIDLARLGDAVSMADGETVRITRGERDRLQVTAGEFEYALAPVDPRAVRGVDWIDDDGTVASLTIDAAALRRAVRAADLVADYATLSVDPDAGVFAVRASGDTDDVSLAFDGDDLAEFEPGEAASIYTVDYLRRIVGAIPRNAAVTVAFLDTEAAERPLALRHSLLDDEGTGRWLLAPRVKR